MGDKYLPTKKDLKNAQRFLNNQRTQSKFITSGPKPVAPPAPAAKPVPKKK